MHIRPHFIALLTYAKSEDGGLKIPAMSGYRPKIRFPFHNGEFSAIQNFIDVENVFPGDTVSAEVTLVDPANSLEKLYEGLDFDFFHNDELIGHGTITKMLPPD
ncbi:MAG: hypothetical protein EOO48_02975 [Flavobacterium sp.]|nr:MAG: hypothetical protein EOO48_02975 [Flavobacterium sp.]